MFEKIRKKIFKAELEPSYPLDLKRLPIGLTGDGALFSSRLRLIHFSDTLALAFLPQENIHRQAMQALQMRSRTKTSHNSLPTSIQQRLSFKKQHLQLKHWLADDITILPFFWGNYALSSDRNNQYPHCINFQFMKMYWSLFQELCLPFPTQLDSPSPLCLTTLHYYLSPPPYQCQSEATIFWHSTDFYMLK